MLPVFNRPGLSMFQTLSPLTTLLTAWSAKWLIESISDRKLIIILDKSNVTSEFYDAVW